MSDQPLMAEAGTSPNHVRADGTDQTDPPAGRRGEDQQLALRLPEWDLVPPVEFVRRGRGHGR